MLSRRRRGGLERRFCGRNARRMPAAISQAVGGRCRGSGAVALARMRSMIAHSAVRSRISGQSPLHSAIRRRFCSWASRAVSTVLLA